MKFLEVKDGAIREQGGPEIRLRGVCLGGWLNMENFITGFPGSESDLRRSVRDELGVAGYEAFFGAFLEHFVTEDDFIFLKSLGSTVVRVPFNWRHFEIPGDPDRFDEKGFHYIDRCVDWGKRHGLYVILDLHAAPLWQNEGWHCDNPHGVSLLWSDAHARRRVRLFWEMTAGRYRDEPAVAAYNLLNEPNAPTAQPINDAYRDWVAAVRRIDTRHIIFLEGNDYSRDFSGLDEPYDGNIGYSPHNYLDVTHKAETYPGDVEGVFTDKALIERKVLNQNRWILDRKRPCWVGEFGAIYDGGLLSPTAADHARLAALSDELGVFARHAMHWTIWTYKDIDVMGLVAPPQQCEYLRRIASVTGLKRRLGSDAWTARGHSPLAQGLNDYVDQLAPLLENTNLDLAAFAQRLRQVGFYAMTAGFISPLFARCFKGMTSGPIEQMMREAFAFKNCRQRTYLNVLLAKAMTHAQ
jgi:endoglucanase